MCEFHLFKSRNGANKHLKLFPNQGRLVSMYLYAEKRSKLCEFAVQNREICSLQFLIFSEKSNVLEC